MRSTCIEKFEYSFRFIIPNFLQSARKHYLFYLDVLKHSKNSFYRAILQALMIKANDEVESLKDQIQELNSLREKDLNANRKTCKDMSTLQEQLEDLRKREMDLVHKCKQVVS